MSHRNGAPVTGRQLRKALPDFGFVFARTGKHEIWKHPSGASLALPQGRRSGDSIGRVILRRVANANGCTVHDVEQRCQGVKVR